MDRKWQFGAALALALVVPAALAQTPAQERTVMRPDGSVVHPIQSDREPRGNAWWQRDRGAISDEQERRRAETYQDRVERNDMRTREREGAMQNPARQVSPTRGY
jgi:hypothetical protein